MQIATMMGTSTSFALEAVYGESRKKRQPQGAVASWGRDTLSISPEALQAFQAMQVEQQPTRPDGQSPQGKEKEFVGQLFECSLESESQGGAANAKDAQITRLESRIKELQQKIIQVQSSGMPEETKEAMITASLAEMNALMQELNEHKAKEA